MFITPAYKSASHAEGPGFEPQENHILGAPRWAAVAADLLLKQQFPQCGNNKFSLFFFFFYHIMMFNILIIYFIKT